MRVLDAKEISGGMLRKANKCASCRIAWRPVAAAAPAPAAEHEPAPCPSVALRAHASRASCRYNLNAQSHDAAISLVRKVLDSGVNLRYLYVDTVGDPERYQAKLGLNLRQLGWLADHAHALQPEAKADAKRTVMDVMDAERHRLDRVTIKVITILSAARLQLPVYEFRSAHRQDIHTWVDEYLSSESFRQWVDANDLAGYW